MRGKLYQSIPVVAHLQHHLLLLVDIIVEEISFSNKPLRKAILIFYLCTQGKNG